jgi:hypothetical protein
MKRQLLIAQLAMLLEKRVAQDRLARQAFSPGLLNAAAAQILGRQPESARCSSRHCDIAFNVTLRRGSRIQSGCSRPSAMIVFSASVRDRPLWRQNHSPACRCH